MFLREYYEETCDMIEGKVIMEIVLDRAGLLKEYKDFITVSSSSIPQNGSILKSLISYMGSRYELSDLKLNELKNIFIDFMLTSNRRELIYEYSKITEVRDYIVHKLKSHNIKFNMEDVDIVHKSFIETTRKYYSNDYQFSSEMPLAYLRHCYKDFFVPNQGKELLREINKVGTSISVSDGEVSLTDKEEIVFEEVKEFTDFIRVAKNINEVSEDLYDHRREVYYDIFSRYKFNRLREIVSDLNSKFKKAFKDGSSFAKIIPIDINYQADEQDDYRRDKMLAREKFLRVLDDTLKYSITPDRLKDMFKLAIEADSTNKSTKNAKRFFSSEESTVRSRKNKSNPKKFLDLVYAFTSLSELIKYSSSNNVNMFDIPSTIFRHEKYLKRFKSLTEYIELHDSVVEMVETGYTPIYNLPSNDDMYDQLITNKLNKISSIRYVSIKSVLDNDTPDEENVLAEYPSANMFAEEYKLAIANYKMAMEFKVSKIDKLIELLGAQGRVYFDKNTGQWLRVEEILPEQLIKLLLPVFINNANYVHDTNKYLFKTVPDLIKADSNFLFDVVRYNSLRISISSLVVRLIDSLSKIKNELDFIEFLSFWDYYIELKPSINSVYDLKKFLGDFQVNLCLTEGEYIESIQSKYLEMFRDVFSVYADFFNKLREYKHNTQEKLDNNFIKSPKGLGIYEEALTSYSSQIYMLNKVNSTEKFSRVLMLATIDPAGYLFFRGRPITTMKLNKLAFLHSKGWWVIPDDPYEPIKEIKDNENFI